MVCRPSNKGLVVNITGSTKESVLEALGEIAELEKIDPVFLLIRAKNTWREKRDWALPEAVGRRSFATLCLDLAGVLNTARSISPPEIERLGGNVKRSREGNQHQFPQSGQRALNPQHYSVRNVLVSADCANRRVFLPSKSI